MKKEDLEEIHRLRSGGQSQEARRILEGLLATNPDSAILHYQMAWTLDTLGMEREAIVHYETALNAGLSGEDRRGAFVGLGSSLRAVGEYQAALQVFNSALHEFSDFRILKVFRAMTLFNLGRFDSCARDLLLELVETSSDPSIQRYSGALRYYSDKLNQTWNWQNG